MKKIDLLADLFENAGCYVEIDDNNLYITKELVGVNYSSVVGATYSNVDELDYSNLYLDVDFDFTYQLGCEESNFVSYYMNKYVEEEGAYQNNGIYACQTIINGWEMEEKAIIASWLEFKDRVDRLVGLLEEANSTEEDYELIWKSCDKRNVFSFISMFSGDECCSADRICEMLFEILSENEVITDYASKDNNYFVKTNFNRVLLLNDLI